MAEVVAARLIVEAIAGGPRRRFPAGRGLKMVNWSKIAGLTLLAGWIVTTGWPLELDAATTSASDIVTSQGNAGIADTVDIGSVRPVARPKQDASRPRQSANPLWAVPLSALTATQERPIFSASRRPPRPAVVATPMDRVTPAPQKAAEPERPPLALIGAVVGETEAIAVFLDRTNQKIIRLRRSDTYAGWTLSSVLRREATLSKADRTEVLALQRSDAPAGVSNTAAATNLVVPAAGGVDMSFAPFVPRSTPKNGEPDGL
jgi:general secretion pathway protein N